MSTGATVAGHTWHPERPPSAEKFTADEIARLRAGEVVFRYEESAVDRMSGFSATVARASREEVWKHILDVDAYVKFLPYVTASRVALREKPQGSERILCELELTTLGVVTHFDMDNYWFPAGSFMSWALFPRGMAPGLGAMGTWRVEDFEGQPGHTLIVYHTDVNMAWWVPGFLRQRAATRGLPTIVALIRKRAEAVAE
jgi:hypothetical protein